MKKFISTISIFITLLMFSNIQEARASARTVDTDFGPVHYIGSGDTIDYKKTECKIGLQFFISEKGAEYEEFMTKHFSNPDLSSNLLKTAVAKFNAYRDMLKTEYFKYKAKSGALAAGQFELLEECYTLIKNEITDRQENLKQNYKAGAMDRKSLRLTAKMQTINDRFKDRIHFPFAEFLGRMKSFSDGLPCYTNKCSK